MAWIIGLVTRSELDLLCKAGWVADFAPAGLVPPGEDPDAYMVTRAFFVDNDVFKIMTGPDWAKVVCSGEQVAEQGQVPTLHSKIMNIPMRLHGEPVTAVDELDFPSRMYAVGHRDARHAAAELALEADRALVAANRRADDAVSLLRDCLAILTGNKHD